jgi:hypothetical protein
MPKPSLVVSLAVGTVMLLWRFLGTNNNEAGEEHDDLVSSDSYQAFFISQRCCCSPGIPRLSSLLKP